MWWLSEASDRKNVFDWMAKKFSKHLMNYGNFSPPSQQYYNTILQGYRENGLDEKYLQTALENSLFLEHSVNDELYEDEFEDYDLDDDMQMRF